jgi:arylsulfatase A-like enzyme
MKRKPNVIFLTVDSLRADRLGCYGYPRTTSPHVDSLADESALCERMFCSVLPTQPSYTTLYTGQHPIRHGIIGHGGEAELSPSAPFLPEVFLNAGYSTCALDSLWGEKGWFGRGYEYYIDPGIRHHLNLSVTCEELNARAIPWMREHAEEPFFLFMHYWDPHTPYTPPRAYQKLFYNGNPTDPGNHSLDHAWAHPISALVRDVWLRLPGGVVTDGEYVKALYDQEVRHTDDGIGEILGALDDLGLAEDTVVVFVADHGESLDEHGIYFEHHGLYDCTLHVPFLVRWPGVVPEGVRLPQMFQTHDIAPTILEAAGLPIPAAMDGVSFWKLLSGQSEEGGRDKVFSLESTLQAKWSLRTSEFKFILAREPDFYGTPMRELYQLVNDPEEKHNLAAELPDVAASMENQLEGWIAQRLKELGKSKDPLLEQGITMKAVMETH